MPGRESQDKNPDASRSTRRNTQHPHVPRLAPAAPLIRQVPVSKTKDEPPPPRDRMSLKKRGETMEIRWAQFWAEHVRNLLEKHPAHFQALHRLVEGGKEGVSERQFSELREWGYLTSDRSPLPGVKALIDSAFRQTPDGSCIVDPLDVKTADDLTTIKRVEARLAEIGIERFRRLLSDDQKEEEKVVPDDLSPRTPLSCSRIHSTSNHRS